MSKTKVAAAVAGVFAGAFVAGFATRTMYAFRDLVKALDREDAALTRRLIRDEFKDEVRRSVESL